MLPWLAHCVSPFCLGCLGRLSLRACRSSFSRFRLAEDRIVLGDASWQLGFSLLILGCFFLLGVGLGLYMKCARTTEFFGPTISFYHLKSYFIYYIILLYNTLNIPNSIFIQLYLNILFYSLLLFLYSLFTISFSIIYYFFIIH